MGFDFCSITSLYTWYNFIGWPLTPAWHTNNCVICSTRATGKKYESCAVIEAQPSPGSRQNFEWICPTTNFNKLTNTAANVISIADDRHEFISKVVFLPHRFFFHLHLLLLCCHSRRRRRRLHGPRRPFIEAFLSRRKNHLAYNVVKLAAPARERNVYSLLYKSGRTRSPANAKWGKRRKNEYPNWRRVTKASWCTVFKCETCMYVWATEFYHSREAAKKKNFFGTKIYSNSNFVWQTAMRQQKQTWPPATQ